MLMLRYFYLLYLLVCIESVLCFDNISDGVDLRRKRVFRKRRPLKSDRILRRQAYETSDEGVKDRGPVAEIDVASFIHNPDYDSLEENESYETGSRNRKDSSKDYGDYGTLAKLDENSQRRDKSYLEDSHQEYTLQELTSNIEHAKEENTAMDNRARQPKKKSLAQKMKIPFFSHKKDSLQTKKNKKRKLPKNTSKKKVTISNSSPEQGKASKRTIDIYGLNKKKRSYQEHICSICKRKFLTSVKDGTDNKNTVNNMIHNSRQYFQALEEKNKDKLKQISNNNISEAVKEDDEAAKLFEDNEERTKREEDDRQRQLKELEEVQKKIDNIEINMPVYQKTD